MKRIVAVTLAVLAFPLFAQQSEVIDVQVTNLDVVVTDKQGKRVTGLTKNDFEILVDGKPQELTNLSEISRTTTGTVETVQPAPRRILLIVDNGSIALSARRKVFDATRQTLERMLIGPSDRIAVATIARSVKQRLAWTSDKEEVLKTLALIEKDAILPHPELLGFERSLQAIMEGADQAAQTMGPPQSSGGGSSDDQVQTGGNATNSGGGLTRSLPQVDFNEVITSGRNYASTAAFETKQTLSSLNAALTAFAGVPGGRKIIILAGGGMPLNPADAVFQRIESARNQAELSNHRGFKNQRTSSTLTQISGYDVTPFFDAVATTAKMKGVAIYAVNPEFGNRQVGGADSKYRGDYASEFAAQVGGLDGYNRIASATGGAAMIGRPADQVLTEIMNDLDSYYSVGYRSTGALNPKSQIAVKVKKGLNARATLSSGAISRDWEVSDQVIANFVLEPVNPLNISVTMAEAVVDGEKKTIPMTIRIPVDSLKLLEDKGEYAASFAVFVSLGDAGGVGSEVNRQEQSFRWSKDTIAQVKGKTIGFAVNLEVDASRDRVSVGVLDQYSGEAGYTRVMLN